MPPTVPTTRKRKDDDDRAVFRWLCQSDLYALCRDVLYRDRSPNLLSETFHKPICLYTQTTPYTENLYLFQRGSFKTAVLNAARNFQRMLQHPEIRILIASNKGENAEEMLREIQGFCTDPLIVWGFPDLFEADPKRLPEWTQSAITIKSPRRGRGSTVSTIGVTGELTSKHYDHATYDDVVGKENSQTKDLREGVIDFYKKSRPLVDPLTSWGAPSTKDFIGTTWHYADLWAYLLDQRAHHGMRLGVQRLPCWRPCAPGDPLGADVSGHGWVRPTFPERWSIQTLLAERMSMGTADFAAQYLLDPVSADTAHFRRDKVTVLDQAPPHDDLWIAMTVDPAISTKAWADYSALAVGGFDRNGELILLELLRERRDEHALVRQIYDLHARYPTLRAIGFEATGFQKIFRHLLTLEGDRRGYYLPIIGLERDTKITKNVRIAGLQGQWEAGQIKALASCRALADFLDEADKFRPDRESAHDDLLDAVVDLYQLRAKPAGSRQTEWTGDPAAAERARWEQELMARRPDLDTMSRRMAWLHHQSAQQAAQDAEAAALGVGGTLDPSWG